MGSRPSAGSSRERPTPRRAAGRAAQPYEPEQREPEWLEKLARHTSADTDRLPRFCWRANRGVRPGESCSKSIAGWRRGGRSGAVDSRRPSRASNSPCPSGGRNAAPWRKIPKAGETRFPLSACDPLNLVGILTRAPGFLPMPQNRVVTWTACRRTGQRCGAPERLGGGWWGSRLRTGCPPFQVPDGSYSVRPVSMPLPGGPRHGREAGRTLSR